MKFKKEWTEREHNAIIKVFQKWEPSHLNVIYGRRERKVSDTYGLPYTSSSSFAMVSNTNVQAVLVREPEYYFDWLGLTENNEVVAGFTDEMENEKRIVIGII